MALGGAGIVAIVVSGLVTLIFVVVSVVGPVTLPKVGGPPKIPFLLVQSVRAGTHIYASPNLSAEHIGSLSDGQIVQAMNLVNAAVGGGIEFYRIRPCGLNDVPPFKFVPRDDMIDVSHASSNVQDCPLAPPPS